LTEAQIALLAALSMEASAQAERANAEVARIEREMEDRALTEHPKAYAEGMAHVEQLRTRADKANHLAATRLAELTTAREAETARLQREQAELHYSRCQKTHDRVKQEIADLQAHQAETAANLAILSTQFNHSLQALENARKQLGANHAA
jgi:chromosome segregation ATPase